MRRGIAVLMFATLFGSAGAQAPVGGGAGTLIPIPYRTYVALNPLLVPFDIGSVEVESGIAPGVTLGAIGSYTDIDKDQFRSFDAKLRYYPGEVVLRGFSIGLTAGYLRYSTTSVGLPSDSRVSLDTPTLGIIVDYNWLPGTGRNRRFVVGTGVGAKRVLAGADERARVNLDRAYLTGRFVIGYAF